MGPDSPFRAAGDILRDIGAGIDGLQVTAHGYGLKAWVGTATKPTKDHYEAQMIPGHLAGVTARAVVEVGFHAEHRDVAHNDSLVAALAKAEKKWRKALGPDAELGPFLGRPEDWRRLSETWPDVDFEDPDLPLELASRTLDYIEVIQPLLPPT